MPVVKGEAGDVLGEDARLDRPVPGAVRRTTEVIQQGCTDALPPGDGVHVDQMLDDTARTSRLEVGLAAIQPTTASPTVATNRRSETLPSSKCCPSGGSDAKVAWPVAIPSR